MPFYSCSPHRDLLSNNEKKHQAKSNRDAGYKILDHLSLSQDQQSKALTVKVNNNQKKEKRKKRKVWETVNNPEEPEGTKQV